MNIDAYSETWITVAKKAEAIIEAARSRLEQTEQSHSESQFLRGQIAGCRMILQMVKPPAIEKDYSPEMKARDRSGI